ncbi:MAG: hypothetical protein MH204_07185 [Fimbriimonadaceae bacterium]|nr:hypothetical protein [Fimbriimonadaceae bacterium]
MARRTSSRDLLRRGLEVAEAFAGFLVKGDAASAHALLSAQCRGEIEPEALAAQLEAAWEVHGRPVGIVGRDHGGLGEDLADPESGFPDIVDAEARLARIVLMLEPGETDRTRERAGCSLWVNVAAEEGRDVVASFEIADFDF